MARAHAPGNEKGRLAAAFLSIPGTGKPVRLLALISAGGP
jgi:hypothetical protein